MTEPAERHIPRREHPPEQSVEDTLGAARLRAWCTRKGHALHQKDHEADRWVAATAMRLDVPLVAHDTIFTNVASLKLITKLRVD